jgi:hypothetical protein
MVEVSDGERLRQVKVSVIYGHSSYLVEASIPGVDVEVVGLACARVPNHQIGPLVSVQIRQHNGSSVLAGDTTQLKRYHVPKVSTH